MRLDKTKTILVLAPTFGAERMFRARGFSATVDVSIPDDRIGAVAFMGGTDISPSLYGEKKLPVTQDPDNRRDAAEVAMYKRFIGVPKLGICRGAQLLNVLNGGSLYQHVDGHVSGQHYVEDVDGSRVLVSSIHHQMLRPHKDGKLIAWAFLSSARNSGEETDTSKAHKDPEVVFYEKTGSLCFQGHPEFGPDSCTNYFFNLIERLYQ